jgi:hypothetical protein
MGIKLKIIGVVPDLAEVRALAEEIEMAAGVEKIKPGAVVKAAEVAWVDKNPAKA